MDGSTRGHDLHSEDRAAGKCKQEMANAARHGRVPDMGWHLSKDGTQLFTEGTMVALKDVCGRLLGFSKVVLPVTAR